MSQERGILGHVCLSVCLSVTCVSCDQTAESSKTVRNGMTAIAEHSQWLKWTPLDARERSSSASNYWDPAFPHFKFYKKSLGEQNHLLGDQNWCTVPSPLIVHFSLISLLPLKRRPNNYKAWISGTDGSAPVFAPPQIKVRETWLWHLTFGADKTWRINGAFFAACL